MFPLTMTDTTWNWFEPVMNTISEMPTLKEKFMKGFNSWGLAFRKHYMYWQNWIYDHNKHDVEQCTYDLKVLHEIIRKSDEQVLEQVDDVHL